MRNNEKNIGKGSRGMEAIKKYVDKSEVCHRCGKKFRSRKRLTIHVKVHSGEIHACDKCPKTFKTRARMHEHRRRFHSEKNITCESCELTFSSLGSLSRHRKMHVSQENPEEHSLNNVDNHKKLVNMVC
jgi:ribosome-binding protein aMBF1 (putative translation factor)